MLSGRSFHPNAFAALSSPALSQLATAANDADPLALPAMLDGSKGAGWWVKTPEIGVRYTRELLDQGAVVTAALASAPSSTFRVKGVELSRDQVAPSAGVRIGLGERLDVAVTYNAGHPR